MMTMMLWIDVAGGDHDAIIMSGWLRKRTRRGLWTRRFFLLDYRGGLHYAKHPPPPPPPSSSYSYSYTSSSRRHAKVITLVGGAYSRTTPSCPPCVVDAYIVNSRWRTKFNGAIEFRVRGNVGLLTRDETSRSPLDDPRVTRTTMTTRLRARNADEAMRWINAIERVGDGKGRLDRLRQRRRRIISNPAYREASSLPPSGTPATDRPTRMECASQTVDLGLDLAREEGRGGCASSSEPCDVAKNESDDDMRRDDEVDADVENEDGMIITTSPEADGLVNEDTDEEKGERVCCGPKLKDDPKYEKYYRMMRMGLPKEAVRHAMTRDNLDPSILDLDPEDPLKDQLHSTADEIKETSDANPPIDESTPGALSDTNLPIRNDPRFAKYFTMLKMVNHPQYSIVMRPLAYRSSFANHL
ncbi:hypothetical protein ACHAXA_005500 [Cyclostephanos tholiformis]|uniref:PH domain-containing protein n=1 Tax=Cyclostephanos tholiformis TaxID=382380 RepID=A0ABD3R737_9STRA